MSFVEQIIGHDEELVGITSIHWIYMVKGVLWLAAFLGFALLIDDFTAGYVQWDSDVYGTWGDIAFLMVTGIGLLISLFYLIMWITTEIALTTKRVIYKRGWIFIDVKEVDLEELKGVDVDNGMLGAFLGYGSLLIDARFIDNLFLPSVANPYAFVQVMNEMRSKLRSDSIDNILEDEQEHHNTHVKQQETEAQPPQTVPEPQQLNKGPLVFPPDIQKRKEQLRQKMKRVFFSKTHENDSSSTDKSEKKG